MSSSPPKNTLALSELRRRLAQLGGKRKLDALLSLPDARGAIRLLPADELYFAIADVGLSDCTEIVQLASPLQFRTFVDLAAWKKDRLEARQVLLWLHAARGDDPEELLRKVHALDPEVLHAMLRELMVVHDLEEDPDVNPEGVTMETPEGRYLLELKAEGAEVSGLRALLNDLIAENPFEAVRLFEANRWEVHSELEETAYQFRSGRLEDLGFPSLERAMSLFTYVKAPERAGTAGGSPGMALAPSSERPDYLGAVLTALDPVERENLEQELRYLINSVLVSEGADPGDLDAIRRHTETARDYLALGFEQLTLADPSRAADLVRQKTLSFVFRVGFSLTLELKFRADRLAKAKLSRIDGQWALLPEEARTVEALRRKRPLRALKVEGAEPVPFRSRRELAEAQALLSRAEAQLPVFSALLGGTEAAAAEVLGRFGATLQVLEPGRLLVAALTSAVLGQVPSPQPVPEGRLVELCERLFEGTASAPRLRGSALEAARAALRPVVPPDAHAELDRLLTVTFDQLVRELGAAYLAEGRLDPVAAGVVLPIAGRIAL